MQLAINWEDQNKLVNIIENVDTKNNAECKASPTGLHDFVPVIKTCLYCFKHKEKS